MKVFSKQAIALAFGLCLSSALSAGIITGELENTGLDSDGNPVSASGGIDANWDVDGSDAVTYIHPAYAANDGDSLWISSNISGGNETVQSTDYTFETTFDLTGYDAATAMITGSWGVDNYASILLNGVDTGVSLSFGTAAFNALTDFVLNDHFVSGINTLSVLVTNGYDTNLSREPGPMALRFDNLQLSAASVPEPGSLALLGLGLLGLGLSRRRQL